MRCIAAITLVGVLAPPPAVAARPLLLAHRGVHQTFSRDELRWDTCTAARIEPPTHPFLENTLPSMRAAFTAGADVVELDVHPTSDGHFAVFHDWTLECRTNGAGVTREQTLAYVKSLDVGHGYTADGGKTFPLRGTGVGLMPSLSEVLDAFPERRFLIHIKSNDADEGTRLAAYLMTRPKAQLARLWVYGGDKPTERVLALIPEMRGFTRAAAKRCLVRYALYAWTGITPAACGGSLMIVPMNYGAYLWGWPEKLVQRLRAVGTDVIITGATREGSDGLTGIDSATDLEALGPDYDGGVWTNHIEVLGPLVRGK